MTVTHTLSFGVDETKNIIQFLKIQQEVETVRTEALEHA